MPDDALGRPYGVPVRREPVLPNGVLGMLMFVATEIMFFSGLISAFVIGKSNAIGGWLNLLNYTWLARPIKEHVPTDEELFGDYLGKWESRA